MEIKTNFGLKLREVRYYWTHLKSVVRVISDSDLNWLTKNIAIVSLPAN